MSLLSQYATHKPVLEFFGTVEQAGRIQAKAYVAQACKLTDAERQQVTSTGVPVYQSRAGWAVSYLSSAGYLERVSRGVYRLSSKGRAALDASIEEEAFGRQVIAEAAHAKSGDGVVEPAKAGEGPTEPASAEAAPSEVLAQPPFEIMAAAHQEMDRQLKGELLASILERDPEFFEQLVVDLMECLGYGEGERTPYRHDGGIDGKIYRDSLGFYAVYVQAKRYSKGNNVQRPEIQAFIGALNGIDKGVFVTTSKFSPGAVECAERCVHAKVVLIDGERLVQMMMDHDLGVYTRKTFRVKEIDSDYFDGDL